MTTGRPEAQGEQGRRKKRKKGDVSACTVVHALVRMPDDDFRAIPPGIRLRAINAELRDMEKALDTL